MPSAADLTTLTDLKNFISPSLAQTSASDSVLGKIITAVSLGINRYLSRTLACNTLAEVRNGNGRSSMRTLVYPIISVQSVVIAPIAGAPGQTLTPSNGNSVPSITWDRWFIYLNGGFFTSVFQEGKQNVTLNYTGGFITPGQLQLLALPGWTAGAAVAQNQQIAVGGYVYQAINSGTSGASAPATWQTVRNSITNDNGVMWICLGPVPTLPADAELLPGDITEACLEQSALLFKNRTRVGDTGTGVGPDRINYFLKGAHPSTIDKLSPHREVFPTDGMGVK